jgi:HNH endonuclease
MDIAYKQCTREECKQWHPATEEYFYKQLVRTKTKGDYYKFSPWCKTCAVRKQSEYQINHRKEQKERMRKYRETDIKYKIYDREHSKRRRETGKHKEWQRANPDKLQNYNENRSNKKHDITEVEWDSCKHYFGNSCAYCGIDEATAKQTQGHYLHKEHVIYDGADDLSNCIPSCRDCNSYKWIFPFDVWYTEDNFRYTPERVEKIHKWLKTDFKLFQEIKNPI